MQRVVAPLYRKPNEKELDAVAPSRELESRYAELLRQPKTGIFRLLPDSGCATNMRVINAREDCIKYSMPGAGNSFSFRTGNYRIKHLADITFSENELQLTGIFMHAIITDLGDVPLDRVDPSSPGMKFLYEFKPSTSVLDVTTIDDTFAKGIEVQGFRYSKSAPINEGTTYGYRGVAYRGKVVRSADGIAYNELDYDDREDILVTFRIVERGADGSVTIIWRQLAENEAPRIKIPSQKNDGSAEGGN